MAEFVSMGGYGFYIWGSYLVTALLMVVEVILVRRRRQKLLTRLARISARNSQESSERKS